MTTETVTRRDSLNRITAVEKWDHTRKIMVEIKDAKVTRYSVTVDPKTWKTRLEEIA